MPSARSGGRDEREHRRHREEDRESLRVDQLREIEDLGIGQVGDPGRHGHGLPRLEPLHHGEDHEAGREPEPSLQVDQRDQRRRTAQAKESGEQGRVDRRPHVDAGRLPLEGNPPRGGEVAFAIVGQDRRRGLAARREDEKPESEDGRGARCRGGAKPATGRHVGSAQQEAVPAEGMALRTTFAVSAPKGTPCG